MRKTILLMATILVVLLSGCSRSRITNNIPTNQPSSQPSQPSQPQITVATPAQEKPGNSRLEKDRLIERELKGDEAHSYFLTMAGNQYLNAVVEQHGIDVLVIIYAPNGEKIYEVDSPNGDKGPEPIYLVTQSNGQYRVEIKSLEKDAKPGNYQVKIKELRAANDKDQSRVAGYKAYGEAELLKSLRKPENIDQIIKKYQEASTLFQAADEPEMEAETLNMLARSYANKGEYGKSESLYQRSLAIYEKLFGPGHPYVATVLYNLGDLYNINGSYSKAEPLLQRALAIREKVYGPEHLNVALSVHNLGLLYLNSNDYKNAEPLLQRSLAIYEKIFGSDHPNVASILYDLAQFYGTIRDFNKAEQNYQRSLLIYEKTLGSEHPRVALIVNELAVINYEKGDFGKAELLYSKSLAIYEKTQGTEHLSVAQLLLNLADLYRYKADYNKAEPLYLRSLAIREKVLGPEHPQVATTLNNLAVLYDIKKDYEKARLLLERSLKIRQKALGAENPAVAVVLYNLADIYAEQRDYNKAEELAQQALTIMEKSVGPEDRDVSFIISRLAIIYHNQGKYDKAEPLYQRALAIREKAFGKDHPYMASSLNNLCIFYRYKGDIAKAIPYKDRANEIREKEFVTNLIAGSEQEKLIYLDRSAYEMDDTISFHLLESPNSQRLARMALTAILRRKGRALDAMTDNIATIRKYATAQDQLLLDELAMTRSELATLTLSGPKDKKPAQHQQDLKLLAEKIGILENQLSARSVQFKVQSKSITLENIQQAIPNDAALVEFIAYRISSLKTNAFEDYRYAAYIIFNTGDPLYVDLGLATKIDDVVAETRKLLADGKSDLTRELKPAARKLDQLIMQPVRKLLGNKKRLLISPDAALNLVPFDALVDERGQFLVKNYEISYLTSGRDLLRLQNGITTDQPPMVIADPDFAEGPGPKLGEATFNQLQRLTGTAAEANEIKAELDNARLFMQAQATKAVLKSIHSPSILHLATHGYFLNNEDNNATAEQRILVRTKNDESGSTGVKLENPLLRSGLFLANANSNGEEGTLTALEATGLDLWGTKLVVLSACDTGVGEVRTGEGVYGLRRALVLAGAESQMMSLWPVSDQGTRELMVGYYKALKQGAGRSAGLRQVRLSMLKRQNRAHPYYWASFIQSGEWANLSGQR